MPRISVERDERYMINKKYMRLFSFYPYLIAALVILSCLAIWPWQLWGHTSYQNVSLERGIFPNLNLSDGSILTGEFIPSHGRLDSLSFRFLISGRAPDGTVTLELYDSNEKKLCSTTLESGDVMNYRWVRFPIEDTELELRPGESYLWRMRARDYEDASLALYSGSPIIGPEESGQFYYNGIPEEKYLPAVTYTYTDKVDGAHCLPYYTVSLLFGLLLLTACRKFEKTTEEIHDDTKNM